MMFRSALRGALAGAALAVFSSGAALADNTLVMATVNAVGSLNNRMGNHFRDLIADVNSGVSINHVEGSALGTARQVMDQTIAGTVPVFGTDLTWVAPYNPDLNVMNWSFTFRDTDHLDTFFKSDAFAGIVDKIVENAGVRILAARSGQPRYFYSRNPVNSVDDIVGKKVRVPEIKLFIDSWSAMGAVPTPLNFGEVFISMKTGVIDAAFGAPSDTFANNFHLSGPNIVPLGDTISSYSIVINEKVYQGLSDTERATIDKAAVEAVEWASAQAKTEMADLVEQMKETGATVTEIDSGSLRDKALAGGMKMEEEGVWSAGLLDRIQAIQ